jgi:hypothetical protein
MPDDISACLANADYSSETFVLPPGTDTITGSFVGVIGSGDVDLIVEPSAVIPQPTTLSLLGVGLGALGLRSRHRHRAGIG